MVVALKYNFFQLFFNAKQISVRLARFKRSSVKGPAVVLTSHTSYTAFLLDVYCAIQVAMFFFLELFVRNGSVFAESIFVEHTSCLNIVNSKVGEQTKRQKDVK